MTVIALVVLQFRVQYDQFFSPVSHIYRPISRAFRQVEYAKYEKAGKHWSYRTR